MVQGDINEELLLAVNRIQATMETVMQKVENMENTIKETETNLVSIRDDVKILHNEVETIKEEVKITSNYSGKFLEQIKVFKDEVFSLEEENRIKIDDIGLHFQGRQKLYSDNEYDYYKVPVSNGVTLLEGTVQYTCEKVGMKAVCSGPEGCKYNNEENCVVTPLSTTCYQPMSGLSHVLCDGKTPSYCKQLDRIFNYMSDRSSGECGVVDRSFCADGKLFTSGEMKKGIQKIYYGYCAKKK